MPSEKKFNRVLLPQIPFFEEDGPHGVRATGRFLPFLLEEFIARGAIEIVIEDAWRYEKELPGLPIAMRNYIKITKPTGRYDKTSQKLFEPVFDELGLKAESGAVRHIRKASEEQKDLVTAAILEFFGLPKFLLALDQQAQLNFGLKNTLANLRLIKMGCRSTEARANISALIGLFSEYRSMRHDALILHSGAPEDLVRRFLDFSENLYFQKLSEEIHSLGFIRHSIKAVPKINRLVRKIFNNAASRKLVDLGSKAVTIGTKLPVPDSALGEAIFAKQYLPPLINLSAAIVSAQKNFKKYGDISGILGLDLKLDHSLAKISTTSRRSGKDTD
jgi:hypothetical protein